jgi:hypothetical protein
MIIRTICCDMDNSRFWISDKLWHEPKHAISAGRLQYLGFSGWYPDQEHKKLFEVLDAKFQISKMYPGEYMEVEFEVENGLL